MTSTQQSIETLTPESSEANGETILLCLIGLSPAILTETIFSLAAEDPPQLPDRIVVITTALGRQKLEERLFARNGWKELLAALAAQVGSDKLAHRLRFGPVDDCIRVFPSCDRSTALDDIRSQADNDAVAEYLLETVRNFSEVPGKRLIVSLAGGRKTMSALLFSVMMLVGRSSDRITHTLVSEPWDRLPDFIFPGCTGLFTHPDTGDDLNSDKATIVLAELPFIPLRYLFGSSLKRESGSYLSLLRHLRNRALNPDASLHLTFDIRQGKLRVGAQSLTLSPREFALMLIFAEWANEEQTPLTALSNLEEDALANVARRWQQKDDLAHWSHKISDKTSDDDYRKLFSSIRGKLKRAGFDAAAIERLVPCRNHPCIDLPPEHILFLTSDN